MQSQHNFIIGPTDTDSFSASKPDMSPMSKTEIAALIKELNDLSPEYMDWADDGYYPAVVVLKAKNYGLKKEDGSITLRGSSLKDARKEKILLQFMRECIELMLNDKIEQVVDLYNTYVLKCFTLNDENELKSWAKKITITDKILACKGYVEQDILDKKLRRNETVVWDAICHLEDLQEGNKVHLYPAILDEWIETKTYKSGKVKETVCYKYGLKLADEWNKKDHDSEKFLERLYKSIEIMDTVLDMDKFPDYSKKKNKELLQTVLTKS